MAKRIFTLVITAVMIMNMGMTASANAGPSEWFGSDSANVGFTGDCPLMVQGEKLDFDINSLPLDYYYIDNKEEFSCYTDSFTAEYIFYNPTDSRITARLAFPLGMMPEYASFEIDTDEYPVLVNGQETEREIRYTKSGEYLNFDFNSEISKLVDGYVQDDFFSPDMAVTKYTLIPHMEGEIDRSNEIRVMWDGKNSDKTRIIPYNFSSFRWEEGEKAEISASVAGDNPVIYAIGQPFEEFPEYGFYENWEDNAKQLDIKLDVVTEQTTLEELLMELCTQMNNGWNVSYRDTYNIFVSGINRDRDYYTKTGVIMTDSIYSYKSQLVCWYLYDITVGPGETVTNTVKGPVYPDVDLEYEPRKYSYTYLLSPAAQWADFGDIEININTPYHMLEINQKDFMKTDKGYCYKGQGLPEGELEFVLCEVENPQREKSNSHYMMYIMMPLILTVVLCAGSVIFVIRYVSKKDRRE